MSERIEFATVGASAAETRRTHGAATRGRADGGGGLHDASAIPARAHWSLPALLSSARCIAMHNPADTVNASGRPGKETMGDRRRYASSTEVARLAGVSQSTVSRTYTQGGSVSEPDPAKVLAAAGQLGYRPSLIPRIMLTHRSYLVAIVVGGMYNPFYSAVLEQFAIKLPEIGFQPLLVHVDSGDSLDDALPRLASYRVDAVVSALAIRSSARRASLAQLAVPVIAFNTHSAMPGCRRSRRTTSRRAAPSPSCSSSAAGDGSASSPAPNPVPPARRGCRATATACARSGRTGCQMVRGDFQLRGGVAARS